MRRTAIVLALTLAAGCAAADPPYRPQEAAPPAPERSPAATEPESDPPQSEPAESKEPGNTATPASVPTGTQTVNVGDGLRIRIDWPRKPDPLHKVMVDFYVGVRRAIAEGKSGYGENMEFEAEERISQWIRAFTDEGETIRGTARLYDVEVAAVFDGKGAQVNACVDESDVTVVSARTGKPIARQPTWMRKPYAETVLAHRSGDGVWRIRSSQTGGGRCA